jgi:hypothetical protein
MSNEPKDHHYNPCFWTAYWNFSYLKKLREGSQKKEKARDQLVHVWKKNPDKILTDKVANCFSLERAYSTTVYHDQVLTFLKKIWGEKPVRSIGLDDESDAASVNIENMFTEMENLYRPYLIETIRTGRVADLKCKTMLSFFIFTQSIRNPSTWRYLKERFSAEQTQGQGFGELNFFIQLWKVLEERERLFEAISPFLASRWVIYKTRRVLLPLSDHPLVITSKKVIMPLAPDMLLHIDIGHPLAPNDTFCYYRSSLHYRDYKVFKNLTIAQTNNEMIFGAKHFFAESFWRYHFASVPR